MIPSGTMSVSRRDHRKVARTTSRNVVSSPAPYTCEWLARICSVNDVPLRGMPMMKIGNSLVERRRGAAAISLGLVNLNQAIGCCGTRLGGAIELEKRLLAIVVAQPVGLERFVESTQRIVQVAKREVDADAFHGGQLVRFQCLLQNGQRLVGFPLLFQNNGVHDRNFRIAAIFFGNRFQNRGGAGDIPFALQNSHMGQLE